MDKWLEEIAVETPILKHKWIKCRLAKHNEWLMLLAKSIGEMVSNGLNG